MKNSIVILGITALTAASIPSADAGNREWATVGKVLTGVAAVHAIGHILPPPPVIYVPAPPPVIISGPGYYHPPAPVVVYAPPVCPPPRVVAVSHYRHAPYVSVQVGFGRHHKHRRHCH